LSVSCAFSCVISPPGNVVAFGEMGIATTALGGADPTRLTRTPTESSGRGTGLTGRAVCTQTQMLMIASLHRCATTPLEVGVMGGFEIAMMVPYPGRQPASKPGVG
jgi:hypothetical protein